MWLKRGIAGGYGDGGEGAFLCGFEGVLEICSIRLVHERHLCTVPQMFISAVVVASTARIARYA